MKTIIIGIAGGTGSGKSTFTRKLKKEFKDDVAVLYVFFFDDNITGIRVTSR